MEIQSIRHLSLDLWLTLIRSNKSFKTLRNDLFIKAFSIRQSADDVLTIYNEYDRLFNSINEHTGRNLSRHEMLYVILGRLGLDVAGIAPAVLDNFFLEAEELFFRYPPELIDDKIINTLEDIRLQDISISLLSNTAFITGATLRKLLPIIGFGETFDFQVFSDELGCSKPSPQIFNFAFNEVNQMRLLTKAQLLHVGDNPVADFAGATAAGFKALLYNPNNEELSKLLIKTLCTPRLRCTT